MYIIPGSLLFRELEVIKGLKIIYKISLKDSTRVAKYFGLKKKYVKDLTVSDFESIEYFLKINKIKYKKYAFNIYIYNVLPFLDFVFLYKILYLITNLSVNIKKKKLKKKKLKKKWKV